jgi:hypothetical protein
MSPVCINGIVPCRSHLVCIQVDNLAGVLLFDLAADIEFDPSAMIEMGGFDGTPEA